MVNAQEWLQEKFPNSESKVAVTELTISTKSVGRVSSTSRKKPTSFYDIDLAGELELNDFPALTSLIIKQTNLSKVKLVNLPQLARIDCSSSNVFLAVEGLANCSNLTAFSGNEKVSYSALPENVEQAIQQAIRAERQEVKRLTTQKNTLVRQKKDLEEKLKKKPETLAEIDYDLAKKAQGLEKQFKEKSESLEKQLTEKSNQLQQQVNNLEAEKQEVLKKCNQEKQALKEKMSGERQEAFKEWVETKKSLLEKTKSLSEEKNNLQKELTKLNEQKDTFQKSADYLRETLKQTEKDLEEIKKELALSQKRVQENEEEYQKTLTDKEEELRQRNEAFKVVSERNQELQSKLSGASSEIDQLVQWIGKLEGASVEGDAFGVLKKDLEKAQDKIEELQEQLNAKQPKSYWWIYVVIALVGIYLVVK
jgi:DNA repair exonuclease SbcCD ATPase subunit